MYEHPPEVPFLTGKQAYPKPDIFVEGGLLATICFIYLHEPIDTSEKLQLLPADGNELSNGLKNLVDNFMEQAVPDDGKFVKNKA